MHNVINSGFLSKFQSINILCCKVLQIGFDLHFSCYTYILKNFSFFFQRVKIMLLRQSKPNITMPHKSIKRHLSKTFMIVCFKPLNTLLYICRSHQRQHMVMALQLTTSAEFPTTHLRPHKGIPREAWDSTPRLPWVSSATRVCLILVW